MDEGSIVLYNLSIMYTIEYKMIDLIEPEPSYVITEDGNKHWYKDGKPNRDGDLPAVIWTDGTKRWFKDGKLHRDGDLPAEIWADGSKAWCKDCQHHRDGDLPAVICASGTKYWYKDGKQYYPQFFINIKLNIR